jgi:hypothetical protein
MADLVRKVGLKESVRRGCLIREWGGRSESGSEGRNGSELLLVGNGIVVAKLLGITV